jgi:hypothetical protein
MRRRHGGRVRDRLLHADQGVKWRQHRQAILDEIAGHTRFHQSSSRNSEDDLGDRCMMM